VAGVLCALTAKPRTTTNPLANCEGDVYDEEMAKPATKKTLHALVDALPEGEIPAAERYLAFLTEFVADENDDAMDDEERAKLDAALEESWAQAKRGETRPASEILAKLQARG
jgi:hypothetical protein